MLQMKKLQLKELLEFAQNHPVAMWLGLDS
jgi:hypothetical protein